MKKFSTVQFAALGLIFCFYSGPASAGEPVKAESVKFSSGPGQCTLLELYTTEAKSDCIPAENWFSGLKNSPDLWKGFVPVSFHVDHWDSLGWKDKFASKDSGRRLADYTHLWNSASIYAPAIVVDGTEWAGWSRDQGIPLSSRQSGILSVDVSRTGSLTVIFSPSENISQSWIAHAVIVGFDIVSKIQEGENRGRKLSYDFLVLGSQDETMKSSYGKLKAVLRSLTARKDVPCKRTAVIVWVTRQDSPLPVQVTGGYLPPQG